ncbi:hypothetical protein FPY71_17260 [Aureimonas fodinaquatilis]|uniref:Uncharacterized protein n=1 Tax=Aureimonas fodinaquatilis TaxID=2565783 RepID=A0A5B0DRJ2_9HYPH|nr:hypothetical protein [Aureimonas fodinaquatilis]KAA0968625.1 hypothetical protein FPY71_17260 [Aureimonas fodinaquatilis]
MKLPMLLPGIMMGLALLVTAPVMAQDASPIGPPGDNNMPAPNATPGSGVFVIDDLSTGSEYIGGNPGELYPMPRLHIGVQLDAIRSAMNAMSNATPKPDGS